MRTPSQRVGKESDLRSPQLAGLRYGHGFRPNYRIRHAGHSHTSYSSSKTERFIG